MKLTKLYKFKEMNSFQFIALTGFIMTVLANLILMMLDKHVESFWALYLCWLFFFIVGAIINFRTKPEDEHGHHH